MPQTEFYTTSKSHLTNKRKVHAADGILYNIQVTVNQEQEDREHLNNI